jgi:predicted enzyme related to lactoylglutathione lyase
MTDDIERAKKFYGAVIGWTANAGPGGAPVFQHGDVQSADVQKCPPGVPSHFLTYVIVEDLAKANARVEKLGGQVAMAKIDVPTVGSVSVVSDTVGAYFGLFQPATT